jgi:dihydropteroate synthase
MEWKTARRTLSLDRPLIMGILNVTPDSFSDGGKFTSVDSAVARAAQMIADGADILDVGGESTRPGSSRVTPEVEIERVVPIVSEITKRSDIAVSVDTTKHEVASAAVDAGAEIINDISGLRWDPEIADIAARTGAGLILMHSRGSFETMHSEPVPEDIFEDVRSVLHRSLAVAKARGVDDLQIVVDVGIGFGKSFEQNLGLIAKLEQIVEEFARFPLVIGTSRKSFLGKLLDASPADRRLVGSITTAVVAVERGAKIVRVHDVRETVEALKVLTALQ